MNNNTLRKLRETMGLGTSYESSGNARVPENSRITSNSPQNSSAQEEKIFSSENSKTLAEKINEFDMPEPKEAVKKSIRIEDNSGARQIYHIISRGDSRNEMMISALSAKFGKVWEPILLESLIENIDVQEMKKILPSCKSSKELIIYDLYLGLKKKSSTAPEKELIEPEIYDKMTCLDFYDKITSLLASQEFSRGNSEPEETNENPNYIL
ncbi:MAG: hypothetical protein NTV63_01315, partial [Candidatus Woesearchaeota archaeon]|nr:hypothetical protein [Candidatus Woesearchaeota archaeon]